jgi:uncharacterized protein (DUF433 family)
MEGIVKTPEVLGGDPRIEGHRISVLHVADRVLEVGLSPEHVAADYDLSIPDVYRALAYYYDHPDEMKELRRRQANAIEEIPTVDEFLGDTEAEVNGPHS